MNLLEIFHIVLLCRLFLLAYYYYYYYYCYTIWTSLVEGLFFLVILLNQRWSPPLRLQASHSSTFRIVCDVPNIAVFCSESIECFRGTASKFFLKLHVTIPVAPVITGIIVHFRFHIPFISKYKNSCILTSFPLLFARHFYLRVLPHPAVCMLLLLLLLLLLFEMDVSCHRPFLPGNSLEPAVIPTAHASSFTLQYFPYYVWCSNYSCLLWWIYRMSSWYSFQIFP